VRQMVAIYQNASSIQETSVADFVEMQGIKFSQSYALKYQKPNQLVLISQDRTFGELAAYGNGRILRFYSNARKAYRERPSPLDLAGVVDAFGGMSQRLIGSGFDQRLNPVSFLMSQEMPREGKDFQYVGIQTVTGHQAYVVTGLADEAWIK